MFQPIQIIRGIFLIAALMLNSGSAFADNDTANVKMPACRDVASGYASSSFPFDRGYCMGLVQAIANYPSVCMPPGVVNSQVMKVVVKYIDGRPEKLHEKFAPLALEALQAAWPCKR
jgi:Rap1a immunity proteins